ncbi:MAG TPA: FAD-dependent 5-carboxymethylaminomethyl-2-thiouridine(34) oxidoreductase MnmC, partial [Rhodocyclaceae bacterium]|nr:FAD-dependent 5-carboxymethylaminomethyl-2-thiouridine(34) oxidoreductase MnmC [Rhodocyclaceae bacterium]
FARRREMLTGTLGEMRHPARLPNLLGEAPTDKRALVIGAGAAGCTVAERLAARGWQVTLLERNPGPAMEASGNLIGLMHPALSKDDNFMSRITRACALYAQRLLAAVYAEDLGLRWGPSGILQLARDAAQDQEQRETCESLGLPEDLVRYVGKDEASALAGATVAAGGWYFPGSGWLSPPTFCKALLARGGSRIDARYSTPVDALEYRAGEWCALGNDGTVLAQAPTTILASALDGARLFPELPLKRIRGQVSLIPTGSVPDLKAGLCGNGYVTPAMDGRHCFGATFDVNDGGTELRAEGHVTNLGHLQALLPELDTTAFNPQSMDGRVGFRTATPDRLPLLGPLPNMTEPLRREAQLPEVPRHPGLHALLGLGSRGMVWAPLSAELLVARICGEPLPLERDLADAMDPARFLLRAQRKAAKERG